MKLLLLVGQRLVAPTLRDPVARDATRVTPALL